MLIQSKHRIDNIVFTCAILHNMLIDFDEWSEEDDNYNITGDVAGGDLDPRLVNLRQGPVDRSFTGGVHLQENKVEIEDEWFTLRRNLIQHYNVCYGLKQVEW